MIGKKIPFIVLEIALGEKQHAKFKPYPKDISSETRNNLHMQITDNQIEIQNKMTKIRKKLQKQQYRGCPFTPAFPNHS